MSDITKKVFSIDADPAGVEGALRRGDVAPTREPLITRISLPDDEPLARTAPETANAVSPSVFRPQTDADAPARSTLTWIGYGLSALALISLAVLAWRYVADVGTANIGLSGWAAMICGVVLPPLAILLLVFALGALDRLRAESAALRRTAERLTRADTTVPLEVASMAQSIRSELTGVEARLERTRGEFEGFQNLLTEQGVEMDGTTKTMAERSETVSRALSLHRQAFESLAQTFNTQMEAMGAGVDAQRGKLQDVTAAAQADLTRSTEVLSEAATTLTTTAEGVSGTSAAADMTLRDAEARLSDMADRIARSAADLDGVYDRRSEHLSGLAERLSGERDTTETSLFAQTERLGAVDAQLTITETRLTALVDHAKAIQTDLDARLDALGSTLDTADTRSREFTKSLSDRVTDSVASARRDLSLMEAELRALQARLDESRERTLDFEEVEQTRRVDAQQSRRIHLQPLESDFPPVEPPRAPASAPQPEPAFTEDTLNLDDSLAIPEAPETSQTREILSRPGEVRPGKRFGKAAADRLKDPQARGGWRWRDMLGGIDAEDAAAATPAVTSAAQAVKVAAPEPRPIQRPPAGVPLSEPITRPGMPPVVAPVSARPAPPAPDLPDGSEVVARLCEVQLAPSAVVDEGTIIDSARARLRDGTGADAAVTAQRLPEPVTHLRGVLAADLEFKLRAQSFCRSFGASLSGQSEADLRATLGSASGRAFLLCAAALSR